MDTLLQKIIENFGSDEKPKTHIISKDDVVNWMRSDDIEILGALYSFLMKPQCAVRIIPALTLSDYAGFVTHYFERCFHEDPDGDWSDSRYAAARGLISWFGMLWKDDQVDRKELVKLKGWLAGVYKDAEDPVRRCIVDGALEHLFEDHEIADFFTDWKNDSELAIAYAEAAQWSAAT